MFRKAVSTLEGVKAGAFQLMYTIHRADDPRCGLQLSVAFQSGRGDFHVANELYPESKMVSSVEQTNRLQADEQVPQA
jgi:hypothetical protein